MPPKAAPKEKAAKGDEAEEVKRLNSTNTSHELIKRARCTVSQKPDVSANLKNKVPKAAAQKVMMTLAEKGVLTKKEYGKQVIFVYNQDMLETLSTDDIGALEQKTKKSQGGLEERRKGLKVVQTELHEAEALPKTKELDKAISQMQADNDRTLQALLPYRGEGGVTAIQPLDAKEIKKIDDDWTRWRKEWETRRKVYKELLGSLGEGGMIASISEFQDDQGINMDDEEAISIEQGEFGKPVPPIRKFRPAVSSIKANTKRSASASASASVASSQEDLGNKKKKVKKA